MANENQNPEVKESSVQFMLAEYSRIQEAESHNRDSGETRFNIYVTLVSISFAGAWAFWGTIDNQSVDDLRQFYFISLIVSMLLLFIGWHTLKLFVFRWQLTVIYLRKIARIRKWFLNLDTALQNGLIYNTDETKPSFLSKSFFSLSLLTLVVILNCAFMAVTVLMIFLLTIPHLISTESIALVCLLVLLITLFAQYQYYMKFMSKLEKDKFAAFPNPSKTNDD